MCYTRSPLICCFSILTGGPSTRSSSFERAANFCSCICSCILLLCHLVELVGKVVAFIIDLFQVGPLGTQRSLQRFDLQVGDDSVSTSHLPHRAASSNSANLRLLTTLVLLQD